MPVIPCLAVDVAIKALPEAFARDAERDSNTKPRYLRSAGLNRTVSTCTLSPRCEQILVVPLSRDLQQAQEIPCVGHFQLLLQKEEIKSGNKKLGRGVLSLRSQAPHQRTAMGGVDA